MEPELDFSFFFFFFFNDPHKILALGLRTQNLIANWGLLGPPAAFFGLPFNPHSLA